MAGTREVFQQKDGTWGFRIRAANGQVVATDGGQSYKAKGDAVATLEKVAGGEYDDKPSMRHYRTLRRLIGVLGVGLPVIVAMGAWVYADTPIQNTISDYYGTSMRNFFVGILCAIGVFLWSYKGYDTVKVDLKFTPISDDPAGNLACVFAVAVALFPTTSGTAWVARVHALAATLLFLTLAYFSLRLFRAGTFPGRDADPSKKRRDLVFQICGYVMLGAIALIAIYNWVWSDPPLESLRPVFWLESLALWAFGISWFVKSWPWKGEQGYDLVEE